MREALIDYERPSAGRTESHSGGKNRGVFRPKGMVGWVINATIEGEGVINRSRKEFTVRPKDLLLFPPDTIHDYDFGEDQGRWTHLWVYFSPKSSWGELLQWNQPSDGVGRLRVQNQETWEYLVERFSKLIETSQSLMRERQSIIMAILEEILHWCRESGVKESPTLRDPRILKTIDVIHGNLISPFKVEELARGSHLSASRFAHLFKDQVGFTPMQYIEQCRLKRACDLLTMTDKSIAQISEEVGFNSPFYFTRVFSRHYGTSPTGYRSRV